MKLAGRRENQQTQGVPVGDRRRAPQDQAPERTALVDEQVRRVVEHLAAIGYSAPPEARWAPDTVESPDPEGEFTRSPTRPARSFNRRI